MPAPRRRLSLSLPSDLLATASALIAEGKDDPDVPWSTLTELVTWALQEAPAEVKRRTKARLDDLTKKAIGELILDGSNRDTIPFSWRSTPFSMNRAGFVGPEVPEQSSPFSGPYLPLCADDRNRVHRIAGFQVKGKGSLEVVKVDAVKQGVPSPERGKVFVLRLDVGGSPDLMGKDGIFRVFPVLIPPNQCWVDLVVHPDDGPFEAFLQVNVLRDDRMIHLDPTLRAPHAARG